MLLALSVVVRKPSLGMRRVKDIVMVVVEVSG
jgi:hypothetical protein